MDNNVFDSIKHLDEKGNEYWLARKLQHALQYSKWENFHKVIKTAQIACKISQQSVQDCFPEVRKSIISGKGKVTSIIDYKLTRYACYLIVMNGDPRKEVIALGQTYFVVKTRQQELSELYEQLTEDEKRLFIRGDIKQKNMLLAESAHKAGIISSKEYAIFQDYGYKGLYSEGETTCIFNCFQNGNNSNGRRQTSLNLILISKLKNNKNII